MTTIMPAWIKEKTPEGVLCIPGSQPQKDTTPTLIPNRDIESVTESEHEQDGFRFGIIVLKDDRNTPTPETKPKRPPKE